ncbi:MAG: hypothetical protein ACFFEF_05245 [Candidatus Thorarchaeota archaeon]
MSEGKEQLVMKIKRRRQRYYIFGLIISSGLIIAGIMGYMLEGPTEMGYNSLQSSILLTFAILLLFLVPTRDLRRAEAIVIFASERGGTLRIEEVRQNLGLPDAKTLSLLGWMQKQKMVEKIETTNRWVFPLLRKREES